MLTNLSAATGACGLAPNSTYEVSEHQQLPDEIVKNGQYIVTDLDGTILNLFNGKYEPGLDESPSQGPLLEWLNLGGRVVAITGNDLSRTIDRFFSHIPQELRANNQVIIAANGGSALYGTDSDGNLVEDRDYREKGLNGRSTIIATDHVDKLVNAGAKIINEFYATVRENPEYVTTNLSKKFHWINKVASGRQEDYSLSELLTNETNVVPRIELRAIVDENLQPDPELITQVALIGIPYEQEIPTEELFAEGADEESLGLSIKRDGVTTEINVKGMDKSVPVRWIVNSDDYDLDPTVSFSMGDKPDVNDRPLMELQERLGMPFVSVSKKSEVVPEGVYHIGGNTEGSAKLLQELVSQAKDMDELTPVIPAKLDKVVSNVLQGN